MKETEMIHENMILRDKEGYIVDKVWIVGDDTKADAQSLRHGTIINFSSIGEAINYYSERGYQ